MVLGLFAVFNDLMFYSVIDALTFEYNYGFTVGICIMIQSLTGLLLTCFYVADSSIAFDCVTFIGRNNCGGWLIRYVHVNCASFVFLFVYFHMLKGTAYFSFRFSRELVWLSGFTIFILLFLIGFTGYTLVWGQMSYWALTVITNLVTALPIIGFDLLEFIWANVIINTFTLRRFYVLHFLTPFIVIGAAIIHLIVIHRMTTKLFVDLGVIGVDKVFFGLYIIKDLTFSIIVIACLSLLVCSSFVKIGAHPDNFMYVMPFVTPAFIEPEWYFLTYYGVLRSLPHKLLGVICFAYAILLFGLLISSSDYYLTNIRENKILVYLIIGLIISLGVLSVFPLVYPFNCYSLYCTQLFIYAFASY